METDRSYRKVVKGSLSLKKPFGKRKAKLLESAGVSREEKDSEEDPKEPGSGDDGIAKDDGPKRGVDQTLTTAERAFKAGVTKRKTVRGREKVGAENLSYREKVDQLNKHLATLSEHFDIPKVGPG
eukprot:Trichotokara_eunicae@DN5974_c0_g1_i10.p1